VHFHTSEGAKERAWVDGIKSAPGRERTRRYLRFDEAGPTVLSAHSYRLPNAVPDRRTIPREQAENQTYHLLKKLNTSTNSIIGARGNRRPFYNTKAEDGQFNWAHDYGSDSRSLYLQNPSILPLHNTIDRSLSGMEQDLLSQNDLDAVTGGDNRVRYLLLLSANTGGKCFGPENTKLYKLGEAVAYYGVALLDENLDIIPGTDTLIDLNVGPHNGWKYWRNFIGDCRAFLVKGWIYWQCVEYLLKVRIVRTPNDGKVNNIAGDTRKYHTGKDLEYPYTYPNIYGGGLSITVFTKQKIAGGKNFNIFRSVEASNYGTYLQLYPLPHRYMRLQFPTDALGTVEAKEENESKAILPPPSFDGPDTPKTIVTCPENENHAKGRPWVTNCSKPVVSPFFPDDDHGTSCCISLELNGRPVMVGISHTKTKLNTGPWWRKDIRSIYNDKIPGSRYLSRFVAYDSSSFHIVARSGWFCLGFGSSSDAGGNPLAETNQNYRLDLFDDLFECPIIHFPSSLSEVVGDETKAIIGYGINDCTHRVIVVSKEEIASRLV